MRTVLLDCRVVSDRLDGLGRYTLDLLRACALRDWDGLRIAAVLPARLHADHPLPRFVRERAVPHFVSDEPFMSARTQLWTRDLFGRLRGDLYHYPHFNLPLNAPAPSVITVHDLTPLSTPDYFRQWAALKRAYWAWALRSSVRRAARVIVPSRATATALASAVPSAAPKTVAIPEAADPSFRATPPGEQITRTRHRLGLDGPFLLYAGSRRPHKNLQRLLRAFAQIAPDVPHDLVLAGQSVGDTNGLLRLAEKLGLGKRVRWPGYVAHEDLRCLYRLADAFVLVSLEEGFGLGVIEALASATPVVCSNAGAPADVAGDAAVLVDPRSEIDIARGLRAVCLDAALRDELRRRGLSRAAEFTWERAAERTIALYRAVLG